ncbi:MAG TPA: DUF5615 family PIN-like protein [Phycisphaerae bacterium]|nr:DUF5615 family PIN-like protein [Phycisphaerae bacterium]
MKLLLDQGLPRGAVALLRRESHDAVHAGDVGLAEANDAAILERACTEERIVVTLDADFHALLAVSAAAQPSVIRIRIEGLQAEKLTTILCGILRSFEAELHAGAALTVRPARVRIRKLPLVRR